MREALCSSEMEEEARCCCSAEVRSYESRFWSEVLSYEGLCRWAIAIGGRSAAGGGGRRSIELRGKDFKVFYIYYLRVIFHSSFFYLWGVASSTSSPSLVLWLLLYPEDPLLELLTESQGKIMLEVTGEEEEQGKEEEEGKMDISSLVGVFESGLHGLWVPWVIRSLSDDDDIMFVAGWNNTLIGAQANALSWINTAPVTLTLENIHLLRNAIHTNTDPVSICARLHTVWFDNDLEGNALNWINTHPVKFALTFENLHLLLSTRNSYKLQILT